MKLRNKKTGEIADLDDWTLTGANDCITIESDTDKKKIFDYHSLAELNEEWEDYKPAEPLIKDERIRKAVRAWAEANGNKVFEVQVSYQSYGDGSWSLRETTSEEDCGLAFIGKIPGELDLGSRYTIDELCGEEEE